MPCTFNFTLLFMISLVLLLFLRTCRCKTKDPDLRDKHFSDEKKLLEHIAELQHDKMFPVLEAFGDIAKRSSCVAHAVRLEAASGKQACRIAKSFKYSISDEGPEASVTLVRPVPIKSLIPWFVDVDQSDGKQPQCEHPVAEEEIYNDLPPSEATPAVDASDEAMWDLSDCLQLSGLLHTISNSVKNLKQVVPDWQRKIRGLVVICTAGFYHDHRTRRNCCSDVFTPKELWESSWPNLSNPSNMMSMKIVGAQWHTLSVHWMRLQKCSYIFGMPRFWLQGLIQTTHCHSAKPRSRNWSLVFACS